MLELFAKLLEFAEWLELLDAYAQIISFLIGSTAADIRYKVPSSTLSKKKKLGITIPEEQKPIIEEPKTLEKEEDNILKFASTGGTF